MEIMWYGLIMIDQVLLKGENKKLIFAGTDDRIEENRLETNIQIFYNDIEFDKKYIINDRKLILHDFYFEEYNTPENQKYNLCADKFFDKHFDEVIEFNSEPYDKYKIPKKVKIIDNHNTLIGTYGKYLVHGSFIYCYRFSNPDNISIFYYLINFRQNRWYLIENNPIRC